MARYFDFGDSNNTIDFPLSAEFTERKEYYQDYVLGGTRDQSVYGLVRLTNELKVEYDVNGLNFLQNVLGTLQTDTVNVDSTIPANDYRVTTERGTVSLHAAKVSEWELNIETGSPVKANFNVIGTTIGAETAAVFTPDFDNVPLVHCDCSLAIDGAVNTLWTMLNVKVDNGIERIYKTCTVPVDLRLTEMKVTGKVSGPEFYNFASDGSVEIRMSTIGTIVMPNVIFDDLGKSVEGYDLPEADLGFTAYPYSGTTAIWAVINTVSVKW